MPKFKIGDKVVPISKTAPGFGDLKNSHCWNMAKLKGQPYLWYVSDSETWDKTSVLSCSVRQDGGGDFFMESDLKLYIDAKFKKGDKVIVTGCDNNAPSANIGKEAVIKGVSTRDGDNAVVYFTTLSLWYLEKDITLKEGDAQMTKKDLKTGMLVVNQDGSTSTILLGTEYGDIVVRDGGWMNVSDYSNDLKTGSSGRPATRLDVMKVYKPNSRVKFLKPNPNPIDHELIWERKETKEVSKEEVFKILQEKFGCEVKITG